MDIRKVKKLIELLEESGVTEIEVCEGEESVRISRQGSVAAAQTVVQVPDATQASVMNVTPAQPTGDAAVASSTEQAGHQITSPMVGIFYVAPAPDEPPFVSVGDNVKQGDVVCVLEAMKIMNQIEADVSGTVTKVHVSNGEAVEYGQPLFTLSTANDDE